MQKPVNFTLASIITAAAAAGCSLAFQNALGFTLPQEGIYLEEVPGDDGGLTCCGVDTPDYSFYRKQMGLPAQSVANASPADIAGCYYHNHWQALGCDNYQPAVALALFDAGVNQGNGQSVRNLQRALGVPADGVLGSGTATAEHKYVVAHSPIALADAMLAQRRAVYDQIAAAHPSDQQFLGDWLRRCDDLQKAISG